MKRLLCDENHIFEIVKRKKTFCYGIGGFFNNNIYKESAKFHKILFDIDYFVDAIDKTIYIEDKLIKTISLEETNKYVEPGCVFILACEDYLDEIEKELWNYFKERDVLCFRLMKDFVNYDTKLLEERLMHPNIMKRKIPKIIHWCWFGNNDIPDIAEKCIESWKKYAPDFQIKLWNEESFNLDMNKYVREAYNAKKYAFVTDYVRLWAIYKYGGIYLDSDVELVGELDPFLYNHAFSGFESQETIPTGIMGGEMKNPWYEVLLRYYENRNFIVNGKAELTANTLPITQMTEEAYGCKLYEGYVDLDDVVFYPREVFCPKRWDSGEIIMTEKTRCIHHFAGSWKNVEG